MGDIKKQKKKFSKPTHPWQKTRIIEEKELIDSYGLKNKKEIWKMSSLLKKFKDQVKSLTVREDRQADLERKQLTIKLNTLGLLKPGDSLDSVLGLQIKDVLDRRLQTLMLKNGLARSTKQARQFITHSHVMVNNKPMTIPSYLVKVSEENTIAFHDRSSLYDIEHPERVQEPTKENRETKTKAQLLKEQEKRKLTEEEIEAKEIAEKEKAMGSEEEKVVEKLENETPEKEVTEIIETGKTEMDELKK